MKLVSYAIATTIGFLGGYLLDSHINPHTISALDVRTALIAKCVAKPEAINEIEKYLPDNNEGLITPEILRQVLSDVVNHC